jgi:hypothetical protein
MPSLIVQQKGIALYSILLNSLSGEGEVDEHERKQATYESYSVVHLRLFFGVQNMKIWHQVR